MVFTSPIFLFLFLPLTLLSYFLLCKRYRNAFLFLASSAFYYFGEQKMLLLMYGVILLNYLTALFLDWLDGRKNERNARRTALLRRAGIIICVCSCIGLLWYFKYWNFSISIFNHLCSSLGISCQISQADKIILPLGISFYTFHCLSYTLDVYMGKMKAEKNLLHIATYVLMFPQLVAGPIVRYIDIRRQIATRSVSAVGFCNGIRRFCYGMAKKVLLANIFAKVVDKIFAIPLANLDMPSAWLGAAGYTLQIYFDFSGYSDMAIGIAAMFGFHYKENFNYPYISCSVAEFWRRWHISLSSWLRDYVYINLGGNQVGKWRYDFNILMVFLLSGLWHGANMTFVCWGIWYGIFIILERYCLRQFLREHMLFSHLYALLVIIFGWVIFRAESVAGAGAYWLRMLGVNAPAGFRGGDYLQNDVLLALALGIFFSFDWRASCKKFVLIDKSHARCKFFKILSYAEAIILFAFSVASILSNSYNPFIYFRF